MNKAQLQKEKRRLEKSLAEVNKCLLTQQKFAGNENHDMLENLKKDLGKKIVNIENQLVIKG